MVSVFVPDGIVMAADSRQTVGITAVKPVNGAQGTETRILNRVDRPGQPGFPAGTIISQSDSAQKIMLLSKVKVGISACGIGILDGKNVSDYIRTFEINELTSADDVTSVAEKLHKYAFKYFPQVNFFVCGYQNDEPFVYIVNKEI